MDYTQYQQDHYWKVVLEREAVDMSGYSYDHEGYEVVIKKGSSKSPHYWAADVLKGGEGLYKTGWQHSELQARKIAHIWIHRDIKKNRIKELEMALKAIKKKASNISAKYEFPSEEWKDINDIYVEALNALAHENEYE